MKERPILFSGEMVRAILAGRKTQTRRIVKAPNPRCAAGAGFMDGDDGPKWVWRDGLDGSPAGLIGNGNCPYGVIGDRLWVRETWCHKYDDEGAVFNSSGNLDRTCVWYRADSPDVVSVDGDGFQRWNKDGTPKSPWKPSIHMPRWASRITLEVTDVSVERLQEITPQAIQAEGVDVGGSPPPGGSWEDLALSRWQSLWTSINGAESWNSNPWVWVLTFSQMEVPNA